MDETAASVPALPSVAPSAAAPAATSPPASAAGRRYGKRKLADARRYFVSVRCNAGEYATIELAASRSGLSVGAYLRAVGCGRPGPRAVHRAPAGREELARILGELGKIYGELGKIGSNVNQLARGYNTVGDLPEPLDLAVLRAAGTAMRADIAAMRGAVMGALGRGD